MRSPRRFCDRFGLRIDPRAKVGRLGVAYQQIVEIAKAVSCDAQVVVMDEPTAALTQRETERLFAIIRRSEKAARFGHLHFTSAGRNPTESPIA